MISYQIAGDGFLRSGHEPDIRRGDLPIETEEEAWILAEAISVAHSRPLNSGSYACYIYVVDAFTFRPVEDYETRKIVNR